MSGSESHGARYDPTMAAFVVMGLMLLWIGANRLFSGTGLLDYHISVGVLSAVLMAFAVGSLFSDRLTEGIFMVFVAISCGTDAVSALALGTEDNRLMDLVYSLPVLAFTVVYIFRRGRILPAASAVLFAAMVLPSFIGNGPVVYSLLCASGAVFLACGVAGTCGRDLGGESSRAPGHVREKDGPHERVVIAGFFMVAVYGLLSSLSVYDAPFYVAAAMLSACILAVGLYGICKGILLEGIFIFFYSAVSLMFAVGSLLGAGFMISDTVLSIISILCGSFMAMRRQYITGAAALIFGLLSLPGLLFDPGVCWAAGSVCMALILLVYSVSRWVYKESGAIIIPISSADGPLRYPHYSDLGAFAISPTVGSFAMGLLCITASVGESGIAQGFLGVDAISCAAIWVMASILVLCLAAVTMWSRLIVDSVLMLMLGSLGLTLSLAGMAHGSHDMAVSNLFFVVGLGTCAYVYYKRGNRHRFGAAAVLCIALAAGCVLPDLADSILSCANVAVGLMLIASAATKTYGICVLNKVHEIHCERASQTPAEFAHTLISTVGVMAFAILSMEMGYYVVDGGHGLYFVKAVLSAVVLCFGIYALKHGIATEGLLMYMVSMVTFIVSVMHMGHVEEPAVLKMAAAAVFLPLAARLAADRDWMMCVISLLMAVMFGLEAMFEDVVYLELVVALLKAVSCIMAVLAIIKLEIGSESLRAGNDHHGGVHAAGSRMASGSNLTLGLLSIWCGIQYLLVVAGHGAGSETYHWTRVMVCAFLLMFVPALLRERMLTEAMLSLFVGMSSMAFSISVVVFGVPGAIPLEAVYSIGILAVGVVLIFKRSWVLAVAALGTVAGYAIPPLTNTAETIPLGIVVTAVGAILMVYGMMGLVTGGRGLGLQNRHRSVLGSEGDYPLTVASTAGLLVASLLGIMTAMFDMGTAYCVSGMFMALTASVFAIYVLYRGHPGICLFILAVPAAVLSMEMASLVIGQADMVIILLSSALLLMSVPALLSAGHRLFAAVALASCALMAAGVLADMWLPVAAGLMAHAVTSLVWSVDRWVSGEAGRKPILSIA